MTSIRKAPDQLVILVVEDTMLFTREIKHALSEYSVAFAHTLESAKLYYNDYLPDVTFLDIDLPDGNGFDLIDYIRAQDPNACIVILTGSTLKEDIASAEAKGIRNYIVKPFTKSKLEKAIAEYLQLREEEIATMLEQTRQHRQQAISAIKKTALVSETSLNK